MNKLTRKIRNKGYTLNEFCDHIGQCMRWYSVHKNLDNKQNELINKYVDDLPAMGNKHEKL